MHSTVLAHSDPQDIEHFDARAAEADVEHLCGGVDSQHSSQLGHAAGERTVWVGPWAGPAPMRRRPGAPTAWSGVSRWGEAKTSA